MDSIQYFLYLISCLPGGVSSIFKRLATSNSSRSDLFDAAVESSEIIYIGNKILQSIRFPLNHVYVYHNISGTYCYTNLS